ncbi:hypothetical protein Salat_1450900 [Sesamum alatum]|uniref:Uncharacterized protein n=1 Tax=Sesamum alatum TaxID=300844 RepID=A0AAE1YB97_9LAMI|nr:hypothetical protein Salat_1450900 [Sesamum alatum]
MAKYVGIEGETNYFIKDENIFKSITTNNDLQEMFAKFEDNLEVDIYITGQVVGVEGDGYEEDMLQSGVNDHESSSGGEDFDDSDSEHEYRMESDKDEEEEREVMSGKWREI